MPDLRDCNWLQKAYSREGTTYETLAEDTKTSIWFVKKALSKCQIPPKQRHGSRQTLGKREHRVVWWISPNPDAEAVESALDTHTYICYAHHDGPLSRRSFPGADDMASVSEWWSLLKSLFENYEYVRTERVPGGYSHRNLNGIVFRVRRGQNFLISDKRMRTSYFFPEKK